MKQKKALSRRSVLSLLKWIFLGITLLMVSLFLCSFFLVTVLMYGFRSGEVVSKLPDQLIPTAQYLSDNPPIFPTTISLQPVEQADNITSICVRLRGRLDDLGMIPGTAFFYINGSRLPYENVSTQNSTSCAEVKLEPGLHLVEFKPFIWTAEKYQWAITISK